VPFSAFFPAGVANPLIIDRLTRQGSLQGLLRGAVGGLQQVMRRGRFTLPPSVTTATERFRNEADPLRAFMEDRVSFHREYEGAFTARADVYGAYTAWAVLNGFHQMSAARFYESFVAGSIDMAYPITPHMRNGVRGYRGITIK